MISEYFPKYLSKWFVREKKAAPLPFTRLESLNVLYKRYLENFSCAIYVLFGALLVGSAIVLYREYRNQMLLAAQQRERIRLNERPPQKRRPGANIRNQEIITNVMQSVREHAGLEPCQFRMTRSGTIFGKLSD